MGDGCPFSLVFIERHFLVGVDAVDAAGAGGGSYFVVDMEGGEDSFEGYSSCTI